MEEYKQKTALLQNRSRSLQFSGGLRWKREGLLYGKRY